MNVRVLKEAIYKEMLDLRNKSEELCCVIEDYLEEAGKEMDDLELDAITKQDNLPQVYEDIAEISENLDNMLFSAKFIRNHIYTSFKEMRELLDNIEG